MFKNHEHNNSLWVIFQYCLGQCFFCYYALYSCLYYLLFFFYIENAIFFYLGFHFRISMLFPCYFKTFDLNTCDYFKAVVHIN